MVKSTSILAALTSLASLSVLVLALPAAETTALEISSLPPPFKLRDVDGNVTGDYVYTAADLEAYKIFKEKNETGLEARGYWGDFEFFHEQYTLCYGEACNYYASVVFKEWGTDSCDNAKVTDHPYLNGCHNSIMLKGTWFYMNNCQKSDKIWDWSRVPYNSYVGQLVTWNDAYVAQCYAVRDYSDPNKRCGNWASQTYQYTKVVECRIGG